MKQTAALGWALVGAFVASVSCGGGTSGSGPRGFGLACESDKECAAYQLLCSDDSTCVQCLSESDCKPAESCSAGQCKTPTACNDSRDCSNDQVCQQTYGLCVDCITSKDCTGGAVCRQNKCVDRATCDFTSDCTDGLLCDPKQHLCVTCRTDKDCGLKQVCTDNECVSETSKGGGGSGGTSSVGGKSSGGSGGRATAGTDAGGTTLGGSNVGGMNLGGFGGAAGGNGGSAGKAGSGGSGGKAGNGGSGGSGGEPTCGCLASEACTPDQRCVPATLIDDLFDCDDQILAIEGRSGSWQAVADLDINLKYGYMNPGTTWADHTCAAWATGGIAPGAFDTSYAYIQFDINDGLSYDLSAYLGFEVMLESDGDVNVSWGSSASSLYTLKLVTIPGSNLRAVPFTSASIVKTGTPSLSNVTFVRFAPTVPSSFGLAIHQVSLY